MPGLLHAAMEAPAGLGRATGTGWRRRRMGFEFHSVDYFYEHYFNKVHIKMMIKVSCGGCGFFKVKREEERGRYQLLTSTHEKVHSTEAHDGKN